MSHPDETRPEQSSAAESDENKEEPMLFCPVCEERLIGMRCKLICCRCGYYMSCADYY